MEFYKLLLISFFTLQTTAYSVLADADADADADYSVFADADAKVTTTTESNLFRVYIGAGSKNVQFSDVPILPGVEFHFILAFAVDCSSSDSTLSDGMFNVLWDKNALTPDEVTLIKNNNENVKVVLSIGGDSCGTNSVEFNPISVETWVSNAVNSLTSIINDYNLDGIDIDYEHFIADSETFTECMARLVSQLKEKGTISIASIAPYENDEAQSHYQALWTTNAKLFDYVNFQFYSSEGASTDLFLENFEQQSSNYDAGKILVGFSTDVDAEGVSMGVFFEACKTLKRDGKLNGIFGWSADDSKAKGFSFETQSQNVLAAAG